jgi:gliding motility-associated-like protein
LDTCGVSPFDGIAEVNFPTYPPITVDLGGNQTLTCLDDIIANGDVLGGYGNYSYAWSFNNGPIGANNPTVNYFAGQPGTLELEVTDDCGSQGTESITISIPAVPISVDLGNDIQVTCIDQTLLEGNTSGGIGAYSYQWTEQSGSLGTNPTLTFQTDQSTSVILTVTDECGNLSDDIIAIQVPQVSIDVDLGEDLVVDCTQSIPLSGDINGGVGNYSYAWVFNGQNASVTSAYTVNTGTDASLSLTVTDQCGNTSFDQIQIDVPAVPVLVNAGPDLNVTCVDVSQIEATVSGGIGNYSYSWFDGGGVVGVAANVAYTAAEQTTLTISAEDECGNIGSDELIIYVPAIQVLVDAGPDLNVTCVDVSQIEATVSGGIGNYSYTWNDGGGVVGVAANVAYTAAEQTTLTISTEDECGNIGSDELIIYVPPVPINIAISNDTTICIGEIVDLLASATGGVGDFQYEWSTGTSSSDHLYISPTESSLYEVSVEDDCSNTATASVLVNVEDVVPSFSFEYIGEYGIQVTNQTDNAAQISWGFGDEIVSNQNQYLYEFPGLDSWQVTMYVEGPLGCVKSVTEFYNPLANIYIPSAFTPNGDGINDVFLMKGHDLKRFEISIFNRWGDVVFSSNDIEQAWTGSAKNGEFFVPDGVYNYVVTAEGVRGNIIEKNGIITIFR